MQYDPFDDQYWLINWNETRAEKIAVERLTDLHLLNDDIPADAVYNFDEDSSGDRNLMSVAEMAGNIQKYAATVGDKIILYVDLTGGMRHINITST